MGIFLPELDLLALRSPGFRCKIIIYAGAGDVDVDDAMNGCDNVNNDVGVSDFTALILVINGSTCILSLCQETLAVSNQRTHSLQECKCVFPPE